MEEKRTDNSQNDVFANNNGIIKSWKGLALAIAGIIGFIGFLVVLSVLSAIPALKWLTVALTGLLFFAAGIIFLFFSKTGYNLPISRIGKGHHAKVYRPVYEFTYSGKEYTVTDKVYQSGQHPSTGEERELLIDRNNPERFVDIERLKSRSIYSYVFPVIVLALGIYLVVVV